MKKIILFIITGLLFASFNQVQKSTVVNRTFDGVFQAKTFSSSFVDENNTKWFLTETGIVSFDDNIWKLYGNNKAVPTQNLKDFAYNLSSGGPGILIATPNGATLASLPISDNSGVVNYDTVSTPIRSNNVLRVAVGKGDLNWVGTDKGVYAVKNNKWLTPAYEDMYPEIVFKEYPITSMATNHGGDSLYIGTDGGGIARVFRDDVDGITGASVFAQWGPIILPSDNIHSILIASDGAKWFGTDKGIAKHVGDNTLDNWSVFTTDDGLVDNFVQSIGEDKTGKIWFGTKGGVSVFDGTAWSSYTIADGLNSNNILCISVDNNGVVWLGTDNGVISYNKGEFVSYK
jgi:ligand-binding sensor domain-containing protein